MSADLVTDVRLRVTCVQGTSNVKPGVSLALRDEFRAMEESFRKRREGSRDSARDPIVYGVVAADGAFVIRTGTRLFCVSGE